VLGGYSAPSDNGPLYSVEVFDGSKWTSAGVMKAPHAEFAAAASGDSIYVFDVSSEYFNGSSWATLPAPPTPRTRSAAITLPNGKMLLMGGSTTNASNPSPYVDELDPKTHTWTIQHPLMNARVAAAAALDANQHVLEIGGEGSSESLLDSVEVWTNSDWGTSTALGTTRAGTTAVTVTNGTVYLIGGFADSSKAPIKAVSLFCQQQ
jgi:N-acetylneuraminic acid mutarotase